MQPYLKWVGGKSQLLPLLLVHHISRVTDVLTISKNRHEFRTHILALDKYHLVKVSTNILPK